MLFDVFVFNRASLADLRSWKPAMPRSISGLVMQLMRVVNVGGGGLRAEVTSGFRLFSFKAKWSLLAWKLAS